MMNCGKPCCINKSHQFRSHSTPDVMRRRRYQRGDEDGDCNDEVGDGNDEDVDEDSDDDDEDGEDGDGDYASFG